MTVVVSLEDFRPAPRYDGLPWTQARIEEAPASTGPWVTLETVNLSPIDSDPQNPEYRNFTTQLGTAAEQWYRIVFLDADLDTGLPTTPIQNVADDRPVYASVSELAANLKVNATQRHDSLMRMLKAASIEIDSEIGGSGTAPTDIFGTSLPYSNPPTLIRTVCLDRAIEHWNQELIAYGLVGMGEVSGATFSARDTWDRHAHKLAVFKGSWGIA